jgi:hypothetical protein
MKTLAILLLSISSVAYSQTKSFTYNYPVTCGPTIEVIEFFSKTHKEEVIWTGLDAVDSSVYSLWEDAEGNWTLLKKTPEIACVLGVGTKPKII